jgi:hypothetical protein
MPSSQPPTNLDPNQDHAQQLAFINQNFQSLANALNPLIVSDGTTNRIILGKQNDGTYGLRVSQAGIDVGTATNSQLIFNSDQNIFKIALSGTATLTVPNPVPASTTYTTTIAHGLGIVPASLCFVNLPSSVAVTLPGQNTPLPYYNVANGGGTTTITSFMILTRVDSTNLYIDWKSNYAVGLADVDGDYIFKYYLLQETAS